MSKIRTYQAIITKYIGPSNTKGSRIKAIAAAGSVTIHINNAFNVEDNHRNAAESLANKFKWRGTWYGGGTPDDAGYCWVSHDMGDVPHFVTAGE